MRLFLFPLGPSVLQPGTVKPLNIFEPRYLRMVRDSIEQKVPIAVGFNDSPMDAADFNAGDLLPQVRPVCGFGFAEVMEQRMDGTQLIAIPSAGKARINHVSEVGRPYLVVNATPIEENRDLDPAHGVPYLNLHRHLVQWIGRHVVDRSNQEQFIDSLKGPVEVVGAAASFLIRDPDLQQLILETDDINRKLDLVQGIISSSTARI